MQTIKGTIYQIAPIETVGRKGTTKRIVVVKTSAKYENLVPIEVYKDHCNVFDSIKVGGIRISHMSHIERDMSMALTVSKAQRKPYTVRVLAVSATPADRINAAQSLDELAAVWKSLSADEKVAATEAKDKRKGELTTGA